MSAVLSPEALAELERLLLAVQARGAEDSPGADSEVFAHWRSALIKNGASLIATARRAQRAREWSATRRLAGRLFSDAERTLIAILNGERD